MLIKLFQNFLIMMSNIILLFSCTNGVIFSNLKDTILTPKTNKLLYITGNIEKIDEYGIFYWLNDGTGKIMISTENIGINIDVYIKKTVIIKGYLQYINNKLLYINALEIKNK